MSTEFLMKPKVDYAFKEIMMDDKARLGFLSAVLRIPPEDIKETQVLNTNLRRVHEDDKQGILDVRTLLNDEVEIDTEIQLRAIKVWFERSLFYVSKMYVDQIEPGDDYTVFKKCVNISILDFVLFPDDPNFYSCFHIWEDNRHTLFTDKMEFHIIELPKLPAEITEHGNTVLSWAKFISAERKEDFEMAAKESPYIASAYKHLHLISQDEQKRLEYDARLKAQLDHNQMVKEAEETGEKRGMAKGMAKVIAKMLKTMSIEQVAVMLELSVEKVQSILADN